MKNTHTTGFFPELRAPKARVKTGLQDDNETKTTVNTAQRDKGKQRNRKVGGAEGKTPLITPQHDSATC